MNTREFVRKSILNKVSCIPVNKDKTPKGNWAKFYNEIIGEDEIDQYFSETDSVAWVGGTVSGKGGTLACIDVDEKYNVLEASLLERFISKIPRELRDKLLIARTQNNGYHIIFRSDRVAESAQKLANRETTSDEKNETFAKYISEGKTRERAIELAKKDKIRVLLETRENRSYFLVAPTLGYEFISGRLTDISKEEHELLLETARGMNEYFPKANEMRRVIDEDRMSDKSDSPFKAYDDRGDILSLMSTNGWQIKRGHGASIPLKRPGNSPTLKSADYFTDTNKLVVYSTSTIFPTCEGMSPSYVYTLLEHNGDWSQAAKSLAKLGYGKASYHKLGKYSREMKELLTEITNIVLGKEEDDILTLEKELINNLKQQYDKN